jgi:membrane fusion protein, multidrug efflux system
MDPEKNEPQFAEGRQSSTVPEVRPQGAGDWRGQERDRGRLRGPGIRLITGLIVALIVLAGLGYWLATRDLVTTDDAFIESDVVQISPKVSGNVLKVYITDNQQVKAGGLLFEIDPRDYEVRVKQAQAALDAAIARQKVSHSDLALTRVMTNAGLEQASSAVQVARSNLAQARAQAAAAGAQATLAKSDVVRYRELQAKDEVSRQRLEQAIASARSTEAQLDAAHKAVSAAEAQVREAEGKLDEARSAPQQIAVKQAQTESSGADIEQARANLAQAQLELSYTNVRAPVSGRVLKRSVFDGQFVQPGQAMLSIVYGEPWVVANFKETQLAGMQLGQPVRIKVDAFPDRVFKGHVDSFQRGTGSRFSLLPPENATGNYVKVVQRIPVKILFDEPAPDLERLAPGMSVQPTVDLRVRSAPSGQRANAAATDAGVPLQAGSSAQAGDAPAADTRR